MGAEEDEADREGEEEGGGGGITEAAEIGIEMEGVFAVWGEDRIEAEGGRGGEGTRR